MSDSSSDEDERRAELRKREEMFRKRKAEKNAAAQQGSNSPREILGCFRRAKSLEFRLTWPVFSHLHVCASPAAEGAMQAEMDDGNERVCFLEGPDDYFEYLGLIKALERRGWSVNRERISGVLPQMQWSPHHKTGGAHVHESIHMHGCAFCTDVSLCCDPFGCSLAAGGKRELGRKSLLHAVWFGSQGRAAHNS